jgi:secretion/DNA translocation related TadE-like protein
VKRRRPDERGAVSILVVAMVGVVVAVTAALAVVAALVHVHRVAQSGADLAALAGAAGVARGSDGCREAARIATANAVRLTACVLEGRVVRVTVEASGPRWLGRAADLPAEARAGPA